MPVTYELDAEHELIHTHLAGSVTLADVEQHVQELLALPALPARLFVLLDARELSTLPDSELLRGASGALAPLRDRVELAGAAIVVHGLAAYGVFRMSQVLLEAVLPHSMVMRDLDEARRWLAAQRATSADRSAQP